MDRIREKTESAVSAECRANTEAAFLQISYTLAATANTVSDDIEFQVRIGMCGSIIDEINALIRDFKSKAYKKNEDAEDAEDAEN